MNRRFWMAFVACWAVGQVLGFLIHGLWLGDTYKALASIWRPEAEMQSMMWIMLLTSALLVFAFCYIFTRGYENRGLGEGVRYGLWVGLLAGVPQAIDSFVIYPIPLDLSLKWAVAFLGYFVALGTVLAAIYRRDAAAA